MSIKWSSCFNWLDLIFSPVGSLDLWRGEVLFTEDFFFGGMWNLKEELIEVSFCWEWILKNSYYVKRFYWWWIELSEWNMRGMRKAWLWEINGSRNERDDWSKGIWLMREISDKSRWICLNDLVGVRVCWWEKFWFWGKKVGGCVYILWPKKPIYFVRYLTRYFEITDYFERLMAGLKLDFSFETRH